MLLAFSTSRERLANIVSNLEQCSSEGVVAVDRAELAQRLVELNAPKLIVIDQPEQHRAWLRYFVRKFPGLHCALVGIESANVVELLSIVPDATVSIGDPEDWDEFMTVVWNSKDFGSSSSSVVAVGADDVLNLLGMTRASAELEFAWRTLRGRLYVRDGVVVHAERAHRGGLEVACEVLDWPAANVTSRSLTDRSMSASMHVAPAVLLHEVALRKDERSRFAGSGAAQRVFDWLMHIAGVKHACVLHADTGALILQRGAPLEVSSADEEDLAEWTRTCFEYWDGAAEALAPKARDTAGPRLGTAQWGGGTMRLLVPLERRLALLVVAEHCGNLALLREVGEQATDALRALCAPATRSVEAELAINWG